jgi:NADH:ubiquinone oxidoreductase subunit F (NADH-binding)
MPAQQHHLLPLGDQPVTSLKQYRELTGGNGLERASRMSNEDIIQEIRQAGLRGRGGAGFGTAIKWTGAARAEHGRKFLVANGAEGEPGTFKDRYLMRLNPYAIIEGALIGLETIGAERCYIGIKDSFEKERDALLRAIGEFAQETQLVSKLELVLGTDEYLFGEETGMLEVIEGGLPLPHVFPPYLHGLFSGAYGGPETNPTVVDNVETLAHVPSILLRGSDWFRSTGNADTPGTMIFTLSGDVLQPCVREVPLGRTLRQLIDDDGNGVRTGHHLKAVFPGLANSVVPPSAFDIPIGFDAMRAAGTSVGSGGFIVYDESRCMVQVAYLFSNFLHVESCNQCPPCKTASGIITNALERLLSGVGELSHIDEIVTATGWVENSARCYLATSEALVISSILRAYPGDFERHAGTMRCELDHDIQLPKIVDYSPDSGFTYDGLYSRKQPDWSYEISTGLDVLEA